MRRASVPRFAGWTVLLLAAPLALIGALLPANEYKAALGVDALDCDGPLGVFMVAVPALVVFAAGVVLNGLKWRNRLNLIVALVCLAVSALLALNIARAAMEAARQTAC